MLVADAVVRTRLTIVFSCGELVAHLGEALLEAVVLDDGELGLAVADEVLDLIG